jgi:hypothetical protein
MGAMDNNPIILGIAVSVVVIYFLLWRAYDNYISKQARVKRKRKPEYDPYMPDYRSVGERLTDELDEAQARYDEAKRRYTEYMTDKLNHEAQSSVIYLARNNKILAAMRRMDKPE